MISFLAAITLEVQATAHTDFRSPFARKVVTDLCFFASTLNRPTVTRTSIALVQRATWEEL